MKIGEVIKQYREEHGLSQREFARRCGLSGITVDRDKNVNVEFHTAKVLAERLSTLNEIE